MLVFYELTGLIEFPFPFVLFANLNQPRDDKKQTKSKLKAKQKISTRHVTYQGWTGFKLVDDIESLCPLAGVECIC